MTEYGQMNEVDYIKFPWIKIIKKTVSFKMVV